MNTLLMLIRLEIAFWALLILAAVLPSWPAILIATVGALIARFGVYALESSDKEGFWAKVWKR